MHDITLLIAVIALALWPPLFLVIYLLYLHRKKNAHLRDLTKNELENISTQELVTRTLKRLGCQPTVNEDGHICFKYQGDDFYIAAEEDHRFIMIWNPWWATISADNDALPYMKEGINAVNANSLVTTVYTMGEDEKEVGLHSRCHTVFTPYEGELDEVLQALLEQFFTTHEVIKETIQQLCAAPTENEKQERVKVKGFSYTQKEKTEQIA